MFIQLQILPTLSRANSKSITCSGDLFSSPYILLNKVVSSDSSSSEAYMSRRINIFYIKSQNMFMKLPQFSRWGNRPYFLPQKNSYIFGHIIVLHLQRDHFAMIKGKLSALWENFVVSLNFSVKSKTIMISENTFILHEVSYHHVIFWIS